VAIPVETTGARRKMDNFPLPRAGLPGLGAAAHEIPLGKESIGAPVRALPVRRRPRRGRW
jgi:hypothetical protein